MLTPDLGFLQILIRNRATDLDARMHDGTTPLILAARLAVEGMVEELINCHADVNAIDDFGKAAGSLVQTPLARSPTPPGGQFKGRGVLILLGGCYLRSRLRA